MVDGGASGIYITVQAGKFLKDKTTCTNENRITVKVANGETITSTHLAKLVVPGGDILPAYIFDKIHGSLISVSSFVDIGYKVIYDDKLVSFVKNNKTIFSGKREAHSKLWNIDMNLLD